MSILFLPAQPFAQHALLAAALVAVTCGLIAPLVGTRGISFAVHGTAELAFIGAAAGLLVANNPVTGALAGFLAVAVLIATLGAGARERDDRHHPRLRDGHRRPAVRLLPGLRHRGDRHLVRRHLRRLREPAADPGHHEPAGGSRHGHLVPAAAVRVRRPRGRRGPRRPGWPSQPRCS